MLGLFLFSQPLLLAQVWDCFTSMLEIAIEVLMGPVTHQDNDLLVQVRRIGKQHLLSIESILVNTHIREIALLRSEEHTSELQSQR